MENSFFESILENISDGFFALNNELVVTYFNSTAEKILQKKSTEVVGQPLFDSFPQARNTIFDHVYTKALKEREPVSFEAHYEFPQPNWYEVRVYPGQEGISVYFHVISQQREEKEKLALQSQLLNAVNSAVIATDKDNKVFYWNEMAEKLYGWTAEEAYGKDIMEITPGKNTIEAANNIMDQLKKGRKWSGDFIVKRKSGTHLPVFVTNSPIFDSEGQFAGVIGVSNEITERRNAEEALRASELKFRSIVNSSPNAIYLYHLLDDKDLVFVGGNPAADRINKFSHNTLLGKTIEEAFPNLAQTEIPVMYKQVARGEIGNQSFEIKYEDNNIAGYFGVDVFSTGPNAIAVSFVDISEKKLNDERNLLLTSILKNSDDFIGVADENSKVLFINPAGMAMVGIEDEVEAKSKQIKDFFMPEDLPFINDVIVPTVIKNGRWSGEFRFRHFKTGKPIPVLYELFRTLDPSTGKIINLATVTRNITDLKKAEKALLLAENKYRSLVENSHGVIYTVVNDIFQFLSPSIKEVLGYEPEELTGSSYKKIIHSDDLELIDEYLETRLTDKTTNTGVEYRVFHKDKSVRWHRSVISPVYDNTGQKSALVGNAIDITHQKITELALRESEEKYKLIFEKSPLGLIHFDAHLNITEANQTICNLFDITKTDLLGISIDNHPNQQLAEAIKLVLKGQTTTYEGVFNLENTKHHKPVRAIFSPIITEDETIAGAIGLFEDRTLHYQKQEIEKQVAVAKESVRFKQNFLANMSHEIRTPLTGIIGMVEILNNTPLSADQKEYLNILKDSGENLKEIINQVLDFSKIEAGKVKLHFRTFEFESLLSNSKKLFAGICSYKGIEFHTHIHHTIPKSIIADNIRISQIINNLVSNAVKFTDKGNISLSADLVEKDPAKGIVKLRISIKDTGIGIDPEKHHKLFKPFGQIDENDTRSYEGSGLGLSICKELVQLMNGEIGMESTVGEGSTFWFTFEALIAEGDEDASKIITTKSTTLPKKLNILLAEDKVVNQKVIKLILTGMGHKVTIAENGIEAVRLFTPNTFNLILMDIQMPVMDGIKATGVLREKYTHLPPIVGVSANAFEGDKEKYMQMGMNDYITKPIKSKDFEDLIVRLFQ
jgi:PAS domain S-box-containing protein